MKDSTVLFSVINNNPEKELVIASIVLANPKEKEPSGGLGWGTPGTWKAREYLGKFIVDKKKEVTYLSDDKFTFSVEKNSVQSFMFGYSPKIKGSDLDWRTSYLVVYFYDKGGLDALVAPLKVGYKAIEGDEGFKLISISN